jgi:hypothetical protein
MVNDDGLLVAMFKEIAVIQGKRTPDGAWIDSNPWHAQNALEVAIRLIDNAKKACHATTKVELPFSTTRNG